MGIDYSGGIIVGEIGSKLSEPPDYEDGFYDWIDEVGMESMALYYDAGQESQYIGFAVKNVNVSDIDGAWMADVKGKAQKFEELTGVPAQLIGTQNIW